MGLLYNHLATLVCAALSSDLTFLWPMFVDFAAVLDIVFIMAVPIMWFLTAIVFVAQKSADYMHGNHKPSKNPSQEIVYTANGKTSG